MFVKGQVVKLLFPFSDFSAGKPRPALIILTPPGNDIIVCMITKQPKTDGYCISLKNTDFIYGGLPLTESFIRFNRIWTHESSRIIEGKGKIKPDKLNEVIDGIVNHLRA